MYLPDPNPPAQYPKKLKLKKPEKVSQTPTPNSIPCEDKTLGPKPYQA